MWVDKPCASTDAQAPAYHEATLGHKEAAKHFGPRRSKAGPSGGGGTSSCILAKVLDGEQLKAKQAMDGMRQRMRTLYYQSKAKLALSKYPGASKCPNPPAAGVAVAVLARVGKGM